jgi:hypothetical protein
LFTQVTFVPAATWSSLGLKTKLSISTRLSFAGAVVGAVVAPWFVGTAFTLSARPMPLAIAIAITMKKTGLRFIISSFSLEKVV